MVRTDGRRLGDTMVVQRTLFWGLWLLGICLQGCSIPVEVKATEEIKFSMDIDKLLVASKIDKNKLFPNNRIPPDYKLTVPFWYNTNYDLSENEDIKKYKSSIRNLQVKQISYKVTENSLSVDIPSYKEVLEVFLAEKDKKSADDFTKIGHFLPVPAGKFNITERLQLADDGEKTASGYFKDLAFAIGLKGAVVLDGSQDPTPPAGRLTLRIIVEVTLTVDVDLSENP